MRKGLFRFCFGLLGLALWIGLFTNCARQSESSRVEEIFVNGHILTMDDRQPAVEAFAVGQEKIVAVGTSKELRHSYPEARVIDLGGKTAMPGIIESHGHLLSLGQSLLELNLEGIATPEDVAEQVRQRALQVPPGAWITGWGWDEGAWAKNYPTHQVLTDAAPDNPVCLRGLHGFASWVNAKAMDIAGITLSTPDPPNGTIVKDARSGHPTGILTNKAQSLVEKHVPPLAPDQIEKALDLAQEECLKNGLTTVHEANTTSEMLEALRRLKEQSRLKIRVYTMLDATDQDLVAASLARGLEIDPTNRLTIRCLKVFIDGALGSRGAALFEPYSDAPDARGVVVTPEDALFALTVRALRSNFQVAVHAIGDLADRIALDAFRRALQDVPAAKDPRLRVEHAQVVALEDIPAFAPLGLIVSMQPPHCTSDMGWAETRVGPRRIKGAYAWRAFLNTGVHLPLNSDFPGETLNPFYGMYAAETRQTPAGEPAGGWYRDQCLSRAEVLRAYTLEGAFAGFEEQLKGKIQPGMLADLIVLSDDVSSLLSAKLLSLRTLQTYVGGRLVYGAEMP